LYIELLGEDLQTKARMASYRYAYSCSLNFDEMVEGLGFQIEKEHCLHHIFQSL